MYYAFLSLEDDLSVVRIEASGQRGRGRGRGPAFGNVPRQVYISEEKLLAGATREHVT